MDISYELQLLFSGTASIASIISYAYARLLVLERNHNEVGDFFSDERSGRET